MCNLKNNRMLGLGNVQKKLNLSDSSVVVYRMQKKKIRLHKNISKVIEQIAVRKQFHRLAYFSVLLFSIIFFFFFFSFLMVTRKMS